MVNQYKETKDNSAATNSVNLNNDNTVSANKPGSGSPKSRLSMLRRPAIPMIRAKGTIPSSTDPFRFQGAGIDFKAKLIGEREVAEPRGDIICSEAMRLAKASVKSSGAHKPRIILNISIEGIKIKDERTGVLLYNFPASKISFIARDTTDARAFGFIFVTPEEKYKFYGTKTAQTADHAVLSIRDMFQVVFEMKKKQLEEAKQKQEEQENRANEEIEKNGKSNGEGVIVADLLNLETEVENIQLGVNQLRSIPSMPEDDIFSTDWATSAAHTGVGNVNSFNATFPPGNDSSNDSQRTDPFGDSFNSSSSFGNAFQSSLSSKDLFQTGQNVSLPFVQQSVNPFENGKTTSNKSPTLFSTDNAWPGTNGVNVSPTTLQQSTNVSNGFPLLFPNDKMTNGNNSSNDDDWPGTATTNEANKPPVATIEEGFTKLVDMNSLVSPAPVTKSTNPFASDIGSNPFDLRKTKNPFEHILNPPKLSLNDLSAAKISIVHSNGASAFCNNGNVNGHEINGRS